MFIGLTKVPVEKRKEAYAKDVEQDGQPENGGIAKPLMPRMDGVPFNAELQYGEPHGRNEVADASETQPPTARTDTGRPIGRQEKSWSERDLAPTQQHSIWPDLHV